MWELTLKLLIAYAVGSLVGALLVGRMKGVDIRNQGSGNAGGTNALRTQGKVFAAWVMLIDVGKGVFVSAWLVPTTLFSTVPTVTVPLPELSVLLAIAVILGHIYPVFFGFRGGKGAATLIGALLGAAPLIVLYLLAVWLLVVMLSGFVGLATMVATLSLLLIPQLPPTLGLTLPWSELGTAVIGMIIVYAHRGNIWRMIQGTENRAKKLWIFKSKQS